MRLLRPTGCSSLQSASPAGTARLTHQVSAVSSGHGQPASIRAGRPARSRSSRERAKGSGEKRGADTGQSDRFGRVLLPAWRYTPNTSTWQLLPWNPRLTASMIADPYVPRPSTYSCVSACGPTVTKGQDHATS